MWWVGVTGIVVGAKTSKNSKEVYKEQEGRQVVLRDSGISSGRNEI